MLRQGMILEEISVASLSAGGGAFFFVLMRYISEVGFADPVWETRLLRVSFDNESSVL